MEQKSVNEVNGKLYVRRTVVLDSKENESTKEEMIYVNKFETANATVSVGRELKINLGNYQTAGVNVHVSIPCYVEEIEEAYKKAKEFAERKIEEEVKEIRKTLEQNSEV